MTEGRGHNRLLSLPVYSALILGGSFVDTRMSWLVLVGLIPLLVLCGQLTKFSQSQVRRSFYFGGVVYFAIVLVSILQAASTSWTAIDQTFWTVSKIIIWLLTAAVSGGQFLLIGELVFRMRHSPRQLFWLLPIAWAGAEVVRSFAVAILAYGPGGSLSPNWNLGNLGVALAGTPFAYLGRFVGLYGLTMVAVGINLGILWFLQQKHRLAFVTLTPIVFLNLFAWRLYQPSGKSISVAAIHLDARASLKPADTTPTPITPPALVVLPEYSLLLDDPNATKIANQRFGNDAVIVTTVADKALVPHNILTYFSAKNGFIDQQNKTYLVAGGEYVPYLFGWTFQALKHNEILKSFNASQQVSKGTQAEHVVHANGLTIGGLACSGVINLSEYQRLTREGAEVLANPASLSLLTAGSSYHVQERYLTRFHAIANARPFVQASRSGESYILGSDGQQLAFAQGDTQIIEASVQTERGRTLYTLFGERIPLLIGLLTLAVWLRRKRSVPEPSRYQGSNVGKRRKHPFVGQL